MGCQRQSRLWGGWQAQASRVLRRHAQRGSGEAQGGATRAPAGHTPDQHRAADIAAILGAVARGISEVNRSPRYLRKLPIPNQDTHHSRAGPDTTKPTKPAALTGFHESKAQ